MKFPKPTPRVKARKPLLRGKPMSRKRGKTAHARRPRDFAYMGFVASRPCLARLLGVQGNDCEGRIVVHHAFGRRAANADRQTIPLCDGHHRAWHEHRGTFKGWDKERRRTWSRWAIEFTGLEHGCAPEEWAGTPKERP